LYAGTMSDRSTSGGSKTDGKGCRRPVPSSNCGRRVRGSSLLRDCVIGVQNQRRKTSCRGQRNAASAYYPPSRVAPRAAPGRGIGTCAALLLSPHPGMTYQRCNRHTAKDERGNHFSGRGRAAAVAWTRNRLCGAVRGAHSTASRVSWPPERLRARGRRRARRRRMLARRRKR
jgi:hypothetical protein